MKRFIPLLILSVGLLVVAACRSGGADEPTPTFTPEPIEALSFTCAVTEIAAIGPVRVFRGEDRGLTGFDSVNTAHCTFTRPIAFITLELQRAGETAFDQTIALDPPLSDIRFPLPSDLVAVVPARLKTGRYDRRMQATSTNGETIEIVLDYFPVADSLWVFDVAMSPEMAAREALANKLGVGPDTPSLIVFEPVAWPDTSLGCPEPGKVYAQVITPGFRLVFEHTAGAEAQRLEYHTNEDGSVVVFCE